LSPRITNGWTELRDAYELTTCQKLHIEYLGDNFFNVKIDYSNIHSNIIPPFHSLSTAPLFHKEYQLQIMSPSTVSTKLVYISIKTPIKVNMLSDKIKNYLPVIYLTDYRFFFLIGSTSSICKVHT
jgi:hypothetical protein